MIREAKFARNDYKMNNIYISRDSINKVNYYYISLPLQ